MKLDKKLLKDLIIEVIEEGKGDSTAFMRGRIAKTKHKEKQKYDRQQLSAMKPEELTEALIDANVNVELPIHDTPEETKEDIIDAIIEGQEE